MRSRRYRPALDPSGRRRQVRRAAAACALAGALVAAVGTLVPRADADGALYEAALAAAGACAAALAVGVALGRPWCLHAAVLCWTLAAVLLLHLTLTSFHWLHPMRLAASLFMQVTLFRAIASVHRVATGR